MKKMLFLAAGLLFAVPAFANDKLLPVLPADAVRLTLSESADVTVDHDRVSMTLRAEAEGGTTEMVQNDVNKRMTEALNQARRVADKVKVVTGSYNVYQTGKERLWKASQTLTIDSNDATALLRLAGEMQRAGLIASGMNYYLSDEKAATYRNQLLQEATKKLTVQAEAMAKALGKNRVQVVTLNVGGSYRPPVMYKAMRMESMAMAASADMAAPVGDGGEQKVSASVDAMVYLLP